MKEFSTRDYLHLFWSKMYLFIIFITLGLFCANYANSHITPIYQAESQLFVSTPASAIDINLLATGSNFSQQRVKSYADIINGPATLKPIIEKLKLNLSEEELAKSVWAIAPLDTVLIKVYVVNRNPSLSAKIANEIGNQFSKTVSKLEISDGNNISPIKVSIVKYANKPETPISPNKLLNYLIGLVFGLLICLGLIYLKILLDDKIRNEDQLQGLPLLSAIHFDPEATSKPLVSQISKFSSRSEAYRQLRTNLQYMKQGKRTQVIAVTSPLPGEGKTTTAINLAISYADAGFKTLLIEGDMRRPSLQKYMQLERAHVGLAELLSKKYKRSSQIIFQKYLQKTDILNLQIISSGRIPNNPVELLDSDSFRSLIRIVKSKFDIVIVDTPPLLPVSDGAVIGVQCDGVLIVLKAGSTKLAQFKGALDSLNKVNICVHGISLNMIPKSKNGYSYGYRYGYSSGSQYSYGNYQSSKVSSEPYSPEQNTIFSRQSQNQELLQGNDLMNNTKDGLKPLMRLEKLLAEEKANH